MGVAIDSLALTAMRLLATTLDRLNPIDDYKFLVHPTIAGHEPTLFERGLPGTTELSGVIVREPTHPTIVLTANLYTHVADPLARSALDKVDDALPPSVRG